MIGLTTRYLHALEPDSPSIEFRTLIISSEVGMLSKLIAYAAKFPKERSAHLADSKLAIGDALVQLKMLCLDLGFDPEEIEQLGLEHTLERFEDFRKRGKI